ncbi:MAG TPA: transposase [Bacillota bacterium]|nr:transposase [Bacillota bacterium]
MVLPQCLRKRLRTTKRLNEEIRRREWVMRIFPNDDSGSSPKRAVKTVLPRGC